MQLSRRVIQIVVNILIVLFFLAPTIWILFHSITASAQYPKNTQVQRFSDGRVIVSTSPGAGGGPIRNVPEVSYGSTTFRQHYQTRPQTPVLPYLGGYPIPTAHLITSQPHTATPPVDYAGGRTPSVMTICIHNGVEPNQVTTCHKYR